MKFIKLKKNLITIIKKNKSLYCFCKKIKDYYIKKKKNKFLFRNGYEALNLVNSAAAECDFQVFCAYGTLLGIIRDGDFVRADEDIDMGIIDSESFSWNELEKRLNKYGIIKERYFTYNGVVTEQTYLYHNLEIDFFLYKKIKDSLVVQGYFKENNIKYKNDYEFTAKRKEYPKINRIIEKQFKNFKVYIPENYEEYLERAYGPSWRTPDPNYHDDYKKETLKNCGLLHTCK